MRASWRYLKLLYSRGFALFALAPLIIAIVTIPEFVQHTAEIRLGMFDDIETARGVANGAERWAFGYAKLAGLLIGMFGAARFWGLRDRGAGRWWSPRDIVWMPLAAGLVLFLFVPSLPDLIHPWLPEWAYQTLYWGLSLAVIPFLFVILGALFGDRSVGPFANYWRDWRWVPLLLLLLVAAYAPAMGVHYGLHRLAMGLPRLAVWPIMAVDALVVALLASLAGAAFSVAYRAARPLSRA